MNKSFLSTAVQEALWGIKKREGGPFGAVIVKGHRIIAQAHNTVLKTNDPTAHAEINAIRLATKKLGTPFLNRCAVYSTTEPCPMCFAALHWARVSKIFFGTEIKDVKKLGFNELDLTNKKFKSLTGSPLQIKKITHPECLDLLRAWSDLTRKKTY